MKRSILGAVLVLAVVAGCAGQRRFQYPPKETAGSESFRVYDRDWNLRAYVKKGFTDQYCIYDRDWQTKGYIKRNRFSERWEIYDRNWKRKGYVNGGLLPFLRERR